MSDEKFYTMPDGRKVRVKLITCGEKSFYIHFAQFPDSSLFSESWVEEINE